MISVQSSAAYTADALFGPSPTGLAGTVGVLLQDGSGTLVQARSTSGITEHPAGSGLYTRAFTAPVTLGQYTLVWDTGGGSPAYAVEDVDVTLASPIYTPPSPMLVSVADAQAWLRRSHASGQQLADDVALLTLAIAGASQAVINAAERKPFDPTGTNADLARTFRYDGSGFLNLAPYDLRSATSVTLGGQTLTLTDGAGGGDYVPMPRNLNRWGTYDYLTIRSFFRLPTRFLNSPVLRVRDVVVTGKWGMTSVPSEMYLATLIAVDDLYRNPEQAQSRGAGEFQVVEAPRTPGEAGLPAGALEELEAVAADGRVTTVLGTYQADILDALTAALGGYVFSPGQPPAAFSVPPTTAIGYVWVSQTARDDHDHLVGKFTAMVRVYPVQADQIDEETPIDPTPLYQAVDDVNGALRPVQAPAGGSPWFYEITAAQIDHANQYVEFVVDAYGPNPFALA